MGNEHFKRNVSSKVLVNLWTANVGENDSINDKYFVQILRPKLKQGTNINYLQLIFNRRALINIVNQVEGSVR